MPREPIIIGLDESPVVIQVNGVDWSFVADPPPAFLIEMMEVAAGLKKGDLSAYDKMTSLLIDQLDPTQHTQWAEAKYGLKTTEAIATAYIGSVHSLPTEPSSQSGKPRGGAGRKSSPAGTVKESTGDA